MTLKLFLSAGRALELNVYVPFLSVRVHVLRPVPARLVLLFTPGPTSRKFCVFDESVTTNVYRPAFRRVTAFPSCRSRMNRSPTAPCSVLPPEIELGTSLVMLGSVEMTPYSFVYCASWRSLARWCPGWGMCSGAR